MSQCFFGDIFAVRLTVLMFSFYFLIYLVVACYFG